MKQTTKTMTVRLDKETYEEIMTVLDGMHRFFALRYSVTVLNLHLAH